MNEGQLRLEYMRNWAEYKFSIKNTKEANWKDFARENAGNPWGQVYQGKHAVKS